MPTLFCLGSATTALGAVPRVLFLGDSLTFGAGLSAKDAYPSLLQRDLQKEGIPIEIINAGINGSTTDSALARLTTALSKHPTHLVLALGANDGLRGYPISRIKSNLRQTIRLAKSYHLPTLLVGMKTLPTYGQAYAEEFDALYPRLAAEEQVPLVPFLLEGVALDPAFNLPDGFHPNERGQARMAETMREPLKRLLELSRPD